MFASANPNFIPHDAGDWDRIPLGLYDYWHPHHPINEVPGAPEKDMADRADILTRERGLSAA